MPDNTFEEYLTYLTENAEVIRSMLYIPKDAAIRKILESEFDHHYHPLPEVKECENKIAATDSSEYMKELYSGKKLFIYRAFTKYSGEIVSRSYTGIHSVDRYDVNRFNVMMMEDLEHLSIIDFLSERKCDFILVDGSLTGRINHPTRSLRAEGMENFPNIYHEHMKQMLSLSIRNRIPLVFVAKSSESTLFTRYLLEQLGHSEMVVNVTDHLLIRSLATFPGYSSPVRGQYVTSDEEPVSIETLHILPHMSDTPMKVDIFGDGNEYTRSEILNALVWGYSGLKVHNIWLSDVDYSVKFRKSEMASTYLKEFEKISGQPFYETRGERRERLRI